MDDQNMVKLRLESTKKSIICTVVVVGILSFIICAVVAGTIAPDLFDSTSIERSACSKENENGCLGNGNFNLINVEVKLSTHNQILYLELEFKSNLTVNSNVQLNFTLMAIEDKSKELIEKTNKNYSVICKDNHCNTHRIFYIPYIEFSHYRLSMELNGEIPFDSLVLRFKYVTEDFTSFVLGVKYFFLSLSIISFAIFIITSKKVPFRFWSFQTKMLGLVGISLIIFNEPFIAATYEIPNIGWSGFSVFSNVQFAVVLLIYWLVSLQQGASFRFRVFAVIVEAILIILLFSLLFCVYLYTMIYLRFDPTIDMERDLSSNYRGILIAFIVFLVLLAVWITGLLIWSLIKLKSSDLREKIFKISNALMMILTFIGIGIGSFQPIPQTATLLLLSVALFNIYFAVSLWLYVPSHTSYLNYLQKPSNKNEILECDNSINIKTANRL